MGLISSVTGGHEMNRPGNIFVRLVDQISDEDRILLQSLSRIVLSDSRDTVSATACSSTLRTELTV